ncbi:hypothetical protein Tco_1561721 [Tanacetum coccineum]
MNPQLKRKVNPPWLQIKQFASPRCGGRDKCTIDIKWKERQQNPAIFKLQMMVGYHVGNFFLPQIDSGVDYVISFTTDDISEESSTYIGKLRQVDFEWLNELTFMIPMLALTEFPGCSPFAPRSRVFTKLTRLHQNLFEDWISRGIEDAKE